MVERVSSSHKKNLKFIDLSETLEHVLNLTSLTLNLWKGYLFWYENIPTILWTTSPSRPRLLFAMSH